MAVGLILSLATASLFYRQLETRAHAALASAADSYATAVERRLVLAARVPEAIAALVRAGDYPLEPRVFRVFVTDLLERTPSLVITGWFPEVDAAAVGAFEARLQSAGFEGLRVHGPPGCDPAAEARPLFPTALAEPLAGNERVIGFDIGCLVDRRDALMTARDTGMVTATQRLVLVSPPGVSAVNLYAPVYRAGAEIDGVGGRRAAFMGAVGVAMRLDILVEEAIGTLLPAPFLFDLEDRDAPPNNRRLVTASGQTRAISKGDEVDGTADPLERSFVFAGRNWLLRFHPLPDAGRPALALPGTVFLSGLLATALLGGVVWSVRAQADAAAAVAARQAILNRALKQSEEQTRQILDNLFVFVGILDPAGTVIEANRAPLEAAGISLSDVRGKKFWDCYWWSYDAGIQAALREAVARARRGEVVRYDVPVRMAGGSRVLIDFQLSPVKDPAGRVTHLVPSAIDISDRKQAEDRLKLLAAEVDHRAKNMLAVVQAMVALAKGEDVASFRAALTDRVAALARAHTLLAQSRWRGGDLGELLREELAPFVGSGRCRVEVNGPPVRLLPAALQGLAIAFHELVTNAAKYGALSTADGSVAAKWVVESNGALSLSWTERGGPPVAEPARQGFGSKVIARSIQQLGGDLEREWALSGLACRIRIPAEQVLSSDGSSVEQETRPMVGAVNAGGARILVVEDSPLLTLEIEQMLSDLSATIVGPAHSLPEALSLARSEHFDAAILDVNLGGTTSFPVADLLARRGIPFFFATGYDREASLGSRYSGVPVLRKPYQARELAEVLAQILPAG